MRAKKTYKEKYKLNSKILQLLLGAMRSTRLVKTNPALVTICLILSSF